MKKLSILLSMLLFATMTITFTSCDDDADIAYTLEGTWQGNMYMSSSYSGRTYDATSSEVCFSQDPYAYSSGTGYWVDYYSNAPRDYLAYHITLTVRNRIIYVHFYEDGSDIEIRDYRLSDNRFTGRIYMGDSFVDFSLRHVSSPNWNDYGWGYDYWYDDYYYGKPSLGAEQKADSAAEREKPVRKLRTAEQ